MSEVLSEFSKSLPETFTSYKESVGLAIDRTLICEKVPSDLEK